MRKYQRLQSNSLRYSGTYRALPAINWKLLVDHNFLNPNWIELYSDHSIPLTSSSFHSSEIYRRDNKEILLTSRLACKLFYDGINLLHNQDPKTRDSSQSISSRRSLQEYLPLSIQKYYKKKQWRKQFHESFYRIICRLAYGLSLYSYSNCIAEEVCTRILLHYALEKGWNHCQKYWEILPENNQLDHDLLRQLTRVASSEEIEKLYHEGTKVNVRDWFTAFKNDEVTMTNHIFDGYLLIPSVRSMNAFDADVFVDIEL